METNQAKRSIPKKNIVIAAALVVAAVALVLVITQVLVPRNAYLLAEDLVTAGKNGEAVAAFLEVGDYGDSAQRAEALLEENPALRFALAEPGDTVTYGAYEQDGDLSNGSEPVEWIVLAKEDSRILALSKDILDVRQYHHIEDKVLWKTAALTKWLSLDFPEVAFADWNRAAVESVAPLSTEELSLLAKDYVAAEASAYAQAAGLTDNVWWLRENNTYSGELTAAVTDGSGNTDTAHITEFLGVRPAIWVLTDATLIEENATAVAEALQTRQSAYEAAVKLKKMFEYEHAASAFALLGDYLDSAELYQQCMAESQRQTGISAVELLTEMNNSIAQAYSMLEDLNDDSSRAKELQSLCTSFYAYCGEFAFVVDGEEMTVQSDFVYDSEESIVRWVCDQGEDSVFTAEVDGEAYTFFQNGAEIYGMSATEQNGKMEAKVSFQDDVITYTLGEHQTVTTDEEGNVTSREDYEQIAQWTGVKGA